MARNPSAAAWLNAAGRFTLLTATEEVHLGALVRRWQDWPPTPAEAPPAVRRRGLRARDRIASANLRLVAMVVDRIPRPPHVALEDALQAGSVGLIRAAEKFDPARGYKFSTYAYLWIRQSLTLEIDRSGTIRIPANVCSALKGIKNGETSSEQRAAAALVWHGCLSLDAPAPGAADDGGPLADGIEGGRLLVEQLGQAEAIATAVEAMGRADPDGLALLQLHHGDGANLTELGRLEGMGAVRMRQRLEVVTDRLRALPAVEMALAG
jgi:RNA polymerase sigma factor (sigma-70 family)